MATSPQGLSPAAPQLAVKEVQDIYVRQNFQNIQAYLQQQNQLYGFVFYEKVFDEAEEDFKISHNLGYIPNDVLVTRITGTGSVIFKYDKFTKTSLVMDATGPCRIRFFFGSYRNFQSSVNNKDGDSEEFISSFTQAEGATFTAETIPLKSNTGAQLSQLIYNMQTSDIYLRITQAQTINLVDAELVKGQIFFLKLIAPTVGPATLVGFRKDGVQQLIDGQPINSFNIAGQTRAILSIGTGWDILL